MLETIWAELSKNAVFSGGFGLMALGAVLAYCRTIPGRIWHWVRARIILSVEVRDSDQMYDWLCQWLATHPRATRLRYLRARTRYSPDDASEAGVPGGSIGSTNQKPRLFFEPGTGSHWYWWRSRPMLVVREARTGEGGAHSALSNLMGLETLRLNLYFGRPEMISALYEEAWRQVQKPTNRIDIRVARYSDWFLVASRSRRRKDSIVLAEGVLEQLFQDVRWFLAAEQWYADRGIPYRRGYLLEGPPGTGKTSLITVVASELEYGLALISLSQSGLTDDGFRYMLTQVPARTILVIEDIDCATRSRDATSDAKDDSKVTLSGILNAIDGVTERPGQLLFMTTNYSDRLDPALLRPGRTDYRLRLGLADTDQVCRLFSQFYGNVSERLSAQFSAKIPPFTYSPAELQGFLFLFRDSPELAVQNAHRLRELLDDAARLEVQNESVPGIVAA